MSRDPVVYVVQHDNNRDFNDARRFGKLVFVTTAKQNLYPDLDSDDVSRIVKTVQLGMKPFNPDRDFLLLTGDPAVMAMCLREAFSKNQGVRLLKFDRNAKAYYEVGI